MKQFLLTLFTTCFLCTALIAQSPVAYYPFNGNANDAAGTINGTVSGASLTTDRLNNANTAYNFNGTGNHINLGNSTTLRPTAALTVSAWFILENTAGSISGRQIISCTEASGYNLGYDKTSNRLVFQVLRNGAYGSPSETVTQYENNGWHHIAGTFDGRYTRLFIDGVLKATDDAGAVYPIVYSYPFGNVNTYIGGEAAAGFNIDPNYYWQGKIDEVKIYNTALTQAQIQFEYNGIVSQLIHYYPLNNNTNDIINGLNGTSGGALSTTDRFSTANSAYSFDGIDDYINPGNSNFAAGDYSISFWMNASDVSGDRTMINGEDATDITKTFFLVDMSSGVLRFLHRTPSGNSGGVSITSTQIIQPNKWYFITCTKQGTTLTMYINGAQEAVITNAGVTNITGAVTLNFGRLQNGVTSFLRHFAGKLDEIKLHNTAISAARVLSEYGKPGSGNAISLNGNNHIQIPDADGVNDFETNQDFTLECWVKIPPSNQPDPGVGGNYIIDKTAIGNANAPYNLVMNNQLFPQFNGMVFIQRYDGVNQPGLRCTTRVNDDKWHHIAATRTGGTTGVLSIYIDGVLEGTLPDNTTGSTSNNSPLFIGSRYGNFSRLLGAIDEVRIWNIGLTQTQIRERMCRKISSSDLLYNNLTACYNFDESAGNSAFDGTINNNTGARINNPVIQTSGAPIGNLTAFNYSVSPNVTLTHPEGESLQATVTAGSPSGIHVYSVTEAPNTVSGALGTGNNNRYFGVFVVGGTSPQYTATYNYTGNPNVTALNETSLLLYKRTDNAATWVNSNATLNTSANTLTATGENTEYLLGGGFSTLPVSLLDFTVTKQNTGTLLQWSTESEQNNKGFEVQHSTDGVYFTSIGFVKGAGNSSNVNSYSFKHTQPVKGRNYYRLKQIDEDDRSVFSRIQLLRFDEKAALTFYPNPVADVLNIQIPDDAVTVTLYDAMGKKLWQQQKPTTTVIAISAKQFSPGLLVLEVISSNGERFVQKVMKH